ncbi:DUF2892 domain-containing protein [Candidatus Pacearchaeota archaeon]|nr:DUF2892 domain-containing protein [Candidatus Pacearchaeota archaeon]
MFTINKCKKEDMKQNLGRTDRILRFALAFWWLGPWALRFNTEWANWIIIAVGWIALVESFVGWCWLHTLFGINNKNQ